ncbi:MAG TPA: hypothetical protein VGG42_16290, partial [Acidobacteriaceae bacterium]
MPVGGAPSADAQSRHASPPIAIPAPAPTSPSAASSPPRSSAEPPPAAAPPPIPVQTETGRLDGASFRIDIPKNWNRGLVLYFHGYQQNPQVFDPKYPPSR